MFFNSRFIQFGFLFEPDWNSLAPSRVPNLVAPILVVVALLLFGLGLASHREQQERGAAIPGPSSMVVIVSSVLAVLFVLRMARFTFGFDADQTKLVIASAAIPLLVPVADLLMRRYWHHLQKLQMFLHGRLIQNLMKRCSKE